MYIYQATGYAIKKKSHIIRVFQVKCFCMIRSLTKIDYSFEQI